MMRRTEELTSSDEGLYTPGAHKPPRGRSFLMMEDTPHAAVFQAFPSMGRNKQDRWDGSRLTKNQG